MTLSNLLVLKTSLDILESKEYLHQYDVKNTLQEKFPNNPELVNILMRIYTLGGKRNHPPPSP